MADTVKVKNTCPSGITYDLDLLEHGTFEAVAPGDTIEVPAAAARMLADTVWTVEGKKAAEKKKETS